MSEWSMEQRSALFSALSQRRRRIVCYHLRETGRADLRTLADTVSGWLAVGPGPDDSVDHESVRVDLHHVHLPKLDDSGLIDYDCDEQVATWKPVPAFADEVLAVALDADTSTSALDVDEVLAVTGRGPTTGPTHHPLQTDTPADPGRTSGVDTRSGGHQGDENVD